MVLVNASPSATATLARSIRLRVTNMNADYVMGLGLIAKAIGELLVDKNVNLAFTDFMKGLGSFGLHTSITAAMQAPPGQVSPAFQAPPQSA